MRLSKQINACYSLHGETNTCIRNIENIVAAVCECKIDIQSLVVEAQTANNTEQHSIGRLVVSKHLKVSLHSAPYGTSLPPHKHPNAINVLIPIMGRLAVTQYNQGRTKSTLLEAEQHPCLVGLKHYFNQHSLRVTSPHAVFISLRLNSPSSSLAQTLKTEVIFALGLLLLPVYTSASLANDVSGYDCAELAALVSHDSPSKTEDGTEVDLIVEKANQIRQKSDDDENLYTAATLYKKAASLNHPEAQYWLGYLFLMGLGITEDTDMALHWIAASSDQEYPPAQKLLDYILTHEPALDC